MLIRPLLMAVLIASPAAAQIHEHTPATSGVPQGIPLFCANPSVVSVGSGAWSNPATWSTGRAPAAGDRVRISARLECIEVDGHLAFTTDRDTSLTVANLTIMDGGVLDVGSVDTPIPANVKADVYYSLEAPSDVAPCHDTRPDVQGWVCK